MQRFRVSVSPESRDHRQGRSAIFRRLENIFSATPGGKTAALAMLGAVIGVALTPFMAAVWAYEPGIVWSDSESLVERTFGPWLESSGLLTFGPKHPNDEDGLPYEVYGKGFFLVYLLMLPLVRAIRPAINAGRWTSMLTVLAWRAMYVALWVAMIGDFTSYWGKSIQGDIGDALWSAGGGVEILVIMLLLPITIVFGVASSIDKAGPRWIPAALVAAAVAVVPINVFVTDYWPNSFVVPISIACAAIAVGRLVAQRGTVRK